MLVDKKRISGRDLLSVSIRNCSSDYELAVAITEEYRDNKSQISEILTKQEISDCHTYYLNLKFTFAHIIRIS